jgi:glutathione synthase/RimK-type ligase-like ATP-grasp enzyme
MLKSLGMNICIFCNQDSKSATTIKDEAERRGYVCKKLLISDLYIEFEDEVITVQHRKSNLSEFDLFIFRNNDYSQGDIISFATKYLVSKGKKVINFGALSTNNNFIIFNKFQENEIRLLKRFFTTGIKAARDVLMEFEHPIIVKPLDLPKDRYTYSEDWTESYDIVRTEKSSRYELIHVPKTQEFIRVYTIGHKVVGALKKINNEYDQKLNVGKKYLCSIYEPDANLRELAEKSSLIAECEICSFDFVKSNNEWYLIDFNQSPLFLSFNKLSKDKFENLILDYLSNPSTGT